MRIFPGLLLAALLLPNPALPQERPAAPRTSASVELNLFNLDVVVTDPEGRPVHGLTARDFEVRHDGKAVAISNFSEIRGEAFPSATARPLEPVGTGAPAAVEPAAPRPPRRVVLFFTRRSGESSSTRSAASSRSSGRATRR